MHEEEFSGHEAKAIWRNAEGLCFRLVIRLCPTILAVLKSLPAMSTATAILPMRRSPLVEAAMQPGMTVSAVARLHGVSPSLLFKWRQLMSQGG